MNHDPIPSYDELADSLNGKKMLVRQTLSRFRVEYRESDNQDDKFTPGHTRFDVRLYLDSELIYSTVYQCNTRYSSFSGTNVWKCVADDAMSYENCKDLADFLEEYGYSEGGKDEIRNGIKAYEGCNETHAALVAHGVSPSEVSTFFAFLEDNDFDEEIEVEEYDEFPEK